MLPASQRLHLRKEQAFFSESKKVHLGFITLFYRVFSSSNTEEIGGLLKVGEKQQNAGKEQQKRKGQTKILSAVVVPKKRISKAVCRNKVKRKLRAVLFELHKTLITTSIMQQTQKIEIVVYASSPQRVMAMTISKQVSKIVAAIDL